MNSGMNPGMNVERLVRYIDTAWDQSIVPALSEYIRIPNKSVHFDPQWEQHGHMQRAAELMKAWCGKCVAEVEIVIRDGACLWHHLYEVRVGQRRDAQTTACSCGHMDKQRVQHWAKGLDPWSPCCAMVACTVAAARTAATQYSARCSRCVRWPTRTFVAFQRDPDRRQRRAAAPICPPTSMRWRIVSATVAGGVSRCRVRQLRSVLVYGFCAASRRHPRASGC